MLNLPTAGPLLLQALMAQDMYLAGAFILLMCALTLVGTLISDILLALARSAHPASNERRWPDIDRPPQTAARRRPPAASAVGRRNGG